MLHYFRHKYKHSLRHIAKHCVKIVVVLSILVVARVVAETCQHKVECAQPRRVALEVHFQTMCVRMYLIYITCYYTLGQRRLSFVGLAFTMALHCQYFFMKRWN